jgi:hypothetical protein
MSTITLMADVVGVIRRAKHQKFPFQTALMELIDNSVDAGATEINIMEDEGDLVVRDNGHGIKDIQQALVIGSSSKDGKIGRYGVGMKDCCIRYSESTIVSSNGVSVRVPWDDVITYGNHDLVNVCEAENKPGTTITLEGFRSCYKSEILTHEISRVYRYLIEDGNLTITINGKTIEPMRLPEFSETINVTFDFDGRSVHLYGGSFRHDDPMRKNWTGYNSFYNGRLIGSGCETRHGVGDEACTNFAFILQLYDGDSKWSLATNKDDFEESKELLDYCYHAYTREILVKAASEQQDIELKEVEDAVNDKLKTNGNQTRIPKSNKTGRVYPTGNGSKKEKTNTATTVGAYEVNLGDIADGKRPKVMKFGFKSFDSSCVGEVNEVGEVLVMSANLNNQFIGQKKNDKEAMLLLAKITWSCWRVCKPHDWFNTQLINSILDVTGGELI